MFCTRKQSLLSALILFVKAGLLGFELVNIAGWCGAVNYHFAVGRIAVIKRGIAAFNRVGHNFHAVRHINTLVNASTHSNY